MESSREKQLFLAWCANKHPGPLTTKEQEFFSSLLLKCIADAKSGDALRQFDLGVKYVAGIFVPPSLEKAALWLSKAAEQRDPDALSCLAMLYSYGAGVPRSEARAFALMSQAANLGNFVAQFYVAWMYKHRIGTEESPEYSFQWFRSAAVNPKPTGIILTLTTTGSDVTNKQVPTITDLGEMRAIAYFEVGRAFHTGKGVSQNFYEAEKWYLAAARQGHAIAQNELGILYARGFPNKRIPEAIQWWRKAAEEGVNEAALNLAIAYAQGDGIARDIEQAAVWAQKAADLGIIEGHILAGNLECEKIPSLSGNLLRALDHYRKAALAGSIDAQYSVGLAYQKLAVTGDCERKAAFSHTPTDADHPTLINFDPVKKQIGVITDSAERIAELEDEFDPTAFPPLPDECIDQALLWFWLASENGSEEAKSSATTFEKVLDKSQINSLKQRYEDFRTEFAFELLQSTSKQQFEPRV
jgi:uncharacterized protein